MAEEKIKIKKRSSLGDNVQGFSKNCAAALKSAVPNLKKMYNQEISNMKSELGVKIPVYDSALSLAYAALKVPENVVSQACGPIFGSILSIFINNIIAPLKLLVTVLDVRIYKQVIMSIIGVIKECFPKVFSTLWNGLIDMCSKLFGVVKSFIQGKKYISRMCERQMLTEAKRQSFLRRMTDWVKEKAAKVAQYCKSTLTWILKKGWQGFSYIFLKFVYPIAECVSKNNKITFEFNSFIGGDGSAISGFESMATNVGQYLGIFSSFGGAAAASTITTLLLPLSGLFVAFSSITYAFTLFGYMNSAGNVVEMASMFTDVLDDMELI